MEEYTSLFSDVFCEKCVDEVTEKCVAEKVAKNLHTEISVLGLFFAPKKLKTDCAYTFSHGSWQTSILRA